jgi:type II secretory ATPase GspE/PulE/Tfp pilus assembly ATPase PilB-like protein
MNRQAHCLDGLLVADLSAPKVLENLIQQAERANASDIHLQKRADATQIAFRLDGIVTPVSEIPADLADLVFGRIKFLARLKTYQDSLPQDGRIDKADVGGRHDIRVATYPTVTGEKIVLRLFSDFTAPALHELDFPAAVCQELETFLRQTAGLLLLTGPAGSGKTTTIYACLRQLLDLGGRHIITVEDPAARHLLRQDPQVLVIGEIRDEETANIAVRAALTGHLVISTLHAGSCQGVFERLLVMCPDRFAVASVVGLVLNQRLIRRLCPTCRGDGCESCLRTGYKGRAPLVECVKMDEPMRERLRTHELASITPPGSLETAGRVLVERGITNDTELRRILGT